MDHRGRSASAAQREHIFDLRPLYGAHSLAHELADWLAVEASENSRFLFQMTANALRREAPLGMLRKFVVEKGGQFAGTIDLKLNGATLFVDAARIYGLACGTRANNTADRLRLAAKSHRLHPSDVDQWINAFYFIQMLRLKNQHRNYTSFTEMHNHVDPNQLEAADRHALLDALRQARTLQNRLALDYPGSSQGI
ncbi:putative nucleotidyltransferase substrate binding domain-containing protein [Undibacterium arcticum]|uniref:putative nucleotidyltransferase substrate binding domain-containing protein n=1 Tax=Undibacterium arcticum TaxID=1762892 RepID=UPI003614ECC1